MSKVKSLLFSLCLFFSQVVSAYATQAVYVYSGNLFDTFIGPAGYGHETKIAAKFIFDFGHFKQLLALFLNQQILL